MDMSLIIQKTFVDAYNDPTTDEYKELENMVLTTVNISKKC